MNIVIDIILFVIIIATVATGIKKGFVKTVMELGCFLLALILAWRFYAPLADFYDERIFHGKISAAVSNKIDEIVGDKKTDGLPVLFEERPQAFTDILERFNIKTDDAENVYETKAGEGSQTLKTDVSDYISEKTSRIISNVLAFLTIFMAVLIVGSILTWVIGLIFKLPVLRGLNRLLGGLLGALLAYLYVSVLAIIIISAMPALTALSPELFGDAAVNNSILLGFLQKYNLFSAIF